MKEEKIKKLIFEKNISYSEIISLHFANFACLFKLCQKHQNKTNPPSPLVRKSQKLANTHSPMSEKYEIG